MKSEGMKSAELNVDEAKGRTADYRRGKGKIFGIQPATGRGMKEMANDPDPAGEEPGTGVPIVSR